MKKKIWKEKPLQEKLIKMLEERGAVVIKKSSGGTYNPVTGKFFKHNNKRQKGISDLIICYMGTFIAIEVKGGYNKPSEDQENFIERIIKAGGIAMWVNTPEPVEQLLDQLDGIPF